jgi:hypothetical protein
MRLARSPAVSLACNSCAALVRRGASSVRKRRRNRVKQVGGTTHRSCTGQALRLEAEADAFPQPNRLTRASKRGCGEPTHHSFCPLTVCGVQVMCFYFIFTVFTTVGFGEEDHATAKPGDGRRTASTPTLSFILHSFIPPRALTFLPFLRLRCLAPRRKRARPQPMLH